MKIKVLTYNIHKCVGGVDRRYDLGRIVEIINHHQPDIALLQEVVRHSKSLGDTLQVDVNNAAGNFLTRQDRHCFSREYAHL